jgi:hypothetical protein
MIISATIILWKLFTKDQMVTFTKNNNEQGAMTNHWFHQLLTKGVKKQIITNPNFLDKWFYKVYILSFQKQWEDLITLMLANIKET